MESKCFRRGCPWIQEVAHMDDALDQLQQHYRAVHPTKGFYRNRQTEDLESFNVTAEELLEQNNIGSAENPQYDWRHLRSQVRRWREREAQGEVFINAETLAEVDRLVEEAVAAQPAQDVAQNQAPAFANAAFREFVHDGVVAPAAVRWDVNPGGNDAAVPPFPELAVEGDVLPMDAFEEGPEEAL